jgi:acyl-CoA synthetase (AMP-forming)/AMP-acid ligase II
MIDLPDSALTPFVLRHCARLGAKPALVDSETGRSIAYGDLPGAIDAAAGALARAGHAPGDVVGVVLPNVPEFAVDRNGGEVPNAFVVLSGEVELDDLRAYVADRVARHKRVRRIEAVGAIPRSPSGKILRRVLVQQEREATAVGRGR